MPASQPPEASTTSPPSTTIITAPARTRSTWEIPDGVEIAVAASDGLHVLTGSDDRIIIPQQFDDVVADPTGDGWYVVDFPLDDQATGSTIRHIGNDGTDNTVLTADPQTYLFLHDAALVDGHATLFYGLNRIRNGGEDLPKLDELYSLDVDSGDRHKITDVGGWETGVSVSYGGGILAGVWGSEAQVKPWSVDLRGNLDPVDVEQVGLETFYPDSLEEPAAPTALTISADGARITWVSRNRADGIDVNQHVVIVDRDGSNRHEFTLPVAPTRVYGLTDRGQYLVAGSLGSEPSALVDTETGGLLVLPLAGPAAATGQWTESPQWPIPSSVTEDVTQEIRSQEPQWATGHAGSDYAQALADLLVTNDANSTDECTSTARTFPNTTSGDGPFSIELRQFCDDSVAGAWYDVTLVGPQPDGSITGGATRRTLCWRAVSPDGLCV